MTDFVANKRRRTSLRKRLLLGLLAYIVILFAAITLHSMVFTERAEQLLWHTHLTNELDRVEEREASHPGYRWTDTSDMSLYDSDVDTDIPPVLAALPPGVHDDVPIDGQERVVLVRETGGHRKILTLDITELEEREADMTLTVAGSALTLLLLLGALAAWGASRLVAPLGRTAQRIAALRPEQQGQRIELPRDASAELEVIGDALNDYLARNDRFVERERLFIDMASHELRTPVSVIAGATELALKSEDTASSSRSLLERIRSSARGMQELIGLLLVLAKDPARLQGMDARQPLGRLLHDVVHDHEHLAEHKDLSIEVTETPDIEIAGPPAIVQAAIGNLLRNAIENSDRGTIRIRTEAPATVMITDPGHGMSPDEIGATYSRIAHGGGDRQGSGIGLDLIARLCEHLGWHLDLESNEHGTTATLTLRAAPGASTAG